MIESVTDDVLGGDIDGTNLYNLKYSNNLVVDPNTDIQIQEQYKFVNTNYNQTRENANDECYEVNEDVLKNLLDPLVGRVNINHQDFVKSTPIFYAIDNLNKEVTEYLIQRGALINSDKVRNLGGFTPYKFSLNNLKKHSEAVVDNKITAPMYEIVRKNILNDPEYGNNLIINADLIFPQIIMMLEHYLSNKITTYGLKWNHDNLKDLSLFLGDETQSIVFDRTMLLHVIAGKNLPAIVGNDQNMSVLNNVEK